jgi:hypothetical protein
VARGATSDANCIPVESEFGFHRANEEQAGSDRFVPGMWQQVQEARKAPPSSYLKMELVPKQPKIHRHSKVSLYSLFVRLIWIWLIGAARQISFAAGICVRQTMVALKSRGGG